MEPFVLEDADGVGHGTEDGPFGSARATIGAGLAVLACHVTWHTSLAPNYPNPQTRQFYSQIPITVHDAQLTSYQHNPTTHRTR